VLNQTPVRSFRHTNAAASLSDTTTALNASGVLALPYIVLRNDQQDALGAGLAVTEYALGGKSADEISSLWQWVWGRLTIADADTPADMYGVAAPANAQAALSAAS
jgi:chromosome partitioning protein